ncbi:collagen-like domain-containing protein [Paenirhodobacter populi]|uniref:Collagen-like protein n=1 Tax=Paenirhodobacter populi TaxID=2306993 RepID=A0A443IQG3_9RHOB|nr:hypothetical protein [Sinirhodobacter populi]RWR08505.1 hypothetical protein D2T33_15530 [Sinirhodobacter populi]
MKYSEIKSLAEGVAPVVRDLLDKATAPLFAENRALAARLDAMEKRLAEMPAPKDGQDGAPGADGKSITTDDVAPLIAQEVEKAVLAIPAAKDGVDGEPGKDADPEAVAALVHARIKAQLDSMQEAVNAIPEAPELPDIEGLVEASVAEFIAKWPVPTDGKDGADGKSVMIEDVMPVLKARVDKFLGEIPVPKDGRDGADGKDGMPGERGPQGDKGADGIGLAGALIDRDGALVVTLTNGEAKSLGPVIGRDGNAGRDGKDGADGFSFEDLTFVWREGKAYARFERGEIVKEMPIPGLYDAGIYREGKDYAAGEGVTFGGSFWIAQCDTKSKPGDGDDWRQAVKKGRDGRDGELKATREPGPVQIGPKKGGS